MICQFYFDEQDETEVNPTPVPTDGDSNGITIDAQSLYDREYNGENERLDNSDIELFSQEAITAESEYIRSRDEARIEERAQFFSLVPENKTISDHISDDLQGGSLFGYDSFSANSDVAAPSTMSSDLLIVVLCIIGVLLGCGGALLYRKIKKGKKSV